jgi:hypothetical protein
MAKSLVVRRAELLRYGGELSRRAAQYVRMSKIHQRYSIENQAAAIAAYAASRNLIIVRTYRDDGVSGLKIDKREGLKQLIADVCWQRSGFDWRRAADVPGGACRGRHARDADRAPGARGHLGDGQRPSEVAGMMLSELQD